MTEEMMNEGLNGESAESTEMESMESILEQYGEVEELHRGKVVTGTVVNAVDGGWLVDVGYKCEGFLPAKEWSHKVLVEDSEEPAPGEKIQIQVVSIRHGEKANGLVGDGSVRAFSKEELKNVKVVETQITNDI